MSRREFSFKFSTDQTHTIGGLDNLEGETVKILENSDTDPDKTVSAGAVDLEWWQGDHGNEYTERNDGADIDARVWLWTNITKRKLHLNPTSILEIGAGSGNNLRALRQIGYSSLSGIEPNDLARMMLRDAGFDAYSGTAAKPSRTADLVFTSGVLIHIPPDELLAACQGIYDAAERYIVCIEYFSANPEEKSYRGRKLWKRDFGSFWLDNFDLTPLGSGFAWKRTTGLDNLTWFVFKK